MKEGPFVVEKKAKGFVLAAPGMLITADGDKRVTAGIDSIAAQLNRAHAAGHAAGEAHVKAAEDKLSDTYKAQRDGWKKIAEALLAIGLGYEMRGFGDTPPVEILDSLSGGGETVVLESIRDAMFGRAWRVRGSEGKGTCDYPLCPNRAERIASKQPFQLIDVRITPPDGTEATLHVCSSNVAEQEGGRTVMAHECARWATWVQQRAVTGRIDVAR